MYSECVSRPEPASAASKPTSREMLRPGSRWLVAAFAATLGGLGCGGAPATGASSATGPSQTIDVRVRIEGARAELVGKPFVDPRIRARLEQTDQQLRALVGHDLRFEFAETVAPRWHGGFEERSLDALESVLADFAALKRAADEAFEGAARAVRTIRFGYDATLERTSIELGTGGSTLEITFPRGFSTEIPRGGIARAVRDHWYAERAARFLAMDPTRVPRGETEAYVRFLRNTAESAIAQQRRQAAPASARKPRTTEGPERVWNHPRASVILKALSFLPSGRTADGAAATELEAWLAEQSSFFKNEYANREDETRSAPSDSAFRRAEAGWVAWFKARSAALSWRSLADAIRNMQVRRQSDRSYVQHAFPGFDFEGYALDVVVPAWQRAGYPTHESEEGKANFERQLWFDAVLCPPSFRLGDDRPYRCLNSNEDLYRRAIESDGRTERLFRDVVARRDPRWAQAVMVNLLTVEAKDDVLRFWRLVEAEDVLFRPATRVLAAHVRNGSRGAESIFDETPRLYRTYPKRRGVVLNLLLSFGHTRVKWGDFASTFGTSIDREAFRSVLDEGAYAVQNITLLWPALAKGFSRMDVLEPKLDGFVGAWSDALRTSPQWGHFLGGIARALCAEGEQSDLRRLGQYVRKRIARFPSEEPTLRQALDQTQEPCRIR